ncbi:MAG: 4'-phosphopantetheinyl transferase superfamily protein [Phycisphaeraceae bacterium]|nr:4'-phosphopantetheinyl transferase superfamily protein [Phycisphaeraceae bacterium]
MVHPQRIPWLSAEEIRLRAGEVHIWRQVHRRAEDWPLDMMMRGLSEPERQRAAGMRHPKRRMEFIRGRSLLRRLLGRLMNMPPELVPLTTLPSGKPALEHPPGTLDLRFNLSHTVGMTLVATTFNADVGIDVEAHRHRIEPLRLAERFFSPAESATLLSLPSAQIRPAFFRLWVGKEAVVKALGGGIGMGLADFDLTVAMDQPLAMVATRWREVDAAKWTLRELDMPNNYAAAVAVARPHVAVHCWNWHEDK